MRGQPSSLPACLPARSRGLPACLPGGGGSPPHLSPWGSACIRRCLCCFCPARSDFVARVQQAFNSGTPLVEGYAPFCKHVFLPAAFLTPAPPPVSALPITPANRRLLESGYTRRRPEELAVLTRWFPADKVGAEGVGQWGVGVGGWGEHRAGLGAEGVCQVPRLPVPLAAGSPGPPLGQLHHMWQP